MTDQQINAAIAEITGSDKLVGLKKRGLWWRPNAHGYTYNESEAWRITEEEAKKYARPNDVDAVTVERFKLIDYCNDENAIAAVIGTFKPRPEHYHLGLRVVYVRELLCETIWKKNPCSDEHLNRDAIAFAPTRAKAVALLNTLKMTAYGAP